MYGSGETNIAKVSAVVITHNRLSMAEKAIDSVLAQTYTNIELIVVDDASDDGSREKLAKRAEAEGFTYVYIPAEESNGGNHARNLGIVHSTGEYIAYLDDDDEWLPFKTEKQVRFFDENPDYGVVSCFMIREYDLRDRVKETSRGKIEGDIHYSIFSNFYAFSSSLMIKREVLEKCGVWDEKLRFWQDYELCIRFAQITKAGLIPEHLVLYRLIKKDKNRLTNKFEGWISAVEYIEEKHKLLIEQLPPQYYRKHRCLIAEDGFTRALNVGNKQKAKYYFAESFRYGPCLKVIAKAVLGKNGIKMIRTIKGHLQTVRRKGGSNL